MIRSRTAILLGLALSLVGCDRSSGSGAPAPASSAPTGPERAELTFAPAVPAPIHRKAPANVIVDLEVQEITMPIAEGTEYTFWTFGGRVPGKFIRLRQGDSVEFHLKNRSDSKMPHNIDLHAVSGPGGGAEASFVAPGHESVFRFKALNPGLYVYHCATAPVGMHIANGMYGLVLVEPPEGLRPVDREYYVMQGDFYTEGEYHAPGTQAFDLKKAIDEKPTYVLFNGAEGSLTGDHALTAKVGETVRIFVGNGGPNLVSSFHVIGEIFDRAYEGGGTRFQENLQTTLVPSGGAAIVELKVDVPGTYALVDHSIFRAFNKGAIAQLKVTGPEQKEVFSGKVSDGLWEPRAGEGALNDGKPPAASAAVAGRAAFASNCAACHQAEGQGIPRVFPPLAGSDFLMSDKLRAVNIAVHGLKGRVTVNGQEYDNVMPPMGHLSDAELANILTFVRSNWGNSGEAVTPDEVAKERTKAPVALPGSGI